MPKDEFDFEDPLELNGVGLVCNEDTTAVMAECFIEEFMRLGYDHKQILALFRNPHYLGMNLALQKRGEQFVREKIAEVFARRGRQVAWTSDCRTGVAPVSDLNATEASQSTSAGNGDRLEACPALTDPMGEPVPKFNL
jgi:hypothetical protein